MTNHPNEIYIVQNPALGAVIMWRFICGYYSEQAKPVPFPLLFIVLPIIFREDLCVMINKTRKKTGLPKLSEKLFELKQNDSLCTLGHTAKLQRELSFQSIVMASGSHLISVDVQSATVQPLETKDETNHNASTTDMLKAAEKLGAWCSRMSLQEICKRLKVRF